MKPNFANEPTLAQEVQKVVVPDDVSHLTPPFNTHTNVTLYPSRAFKPQTPDTAAAGDVIVDVVIVRLSVTGGDRDHAGYLEAAAAAAALYFCVFSFLLYFRELNCESG